jgi:hypothetical protein
MWTSEQKTQSHGPDVELNAGLQAPQVRLPAAQAILYRGAGLGVVWPQFVIVALIGGLFLVLALWRFRRVAAAPV